MAFWRACPKHLPTLICTLICFLLANVIVSASFYNPDINDFDTNDNLDRFDTIKNTSWIIYFHFLGQTLHLWKVDSLSLNEWWTGSTVVLCTKCEMLLLTDRLPRAALRVVRATREKLLEGFKVSLSREPRSLEELRQQSIEEIALKNPSTLALLFFYFYKQCTFTIEKNQKYKAFRKKVEITHFLTFSLLLCIHLGFCIYMQCM